MVVAVISGEGRRAFSLLGAFREGMSAVGEGVRGTWIWVGVLD